MRRITFSLAAPAERWPHWATTGIAVSEALAEELKLQCPDSPWHGHRDRLAALMAALSIYTASLGKMALDVALLMQYRSRRGR